MFDLETLRLIKKTFRRFLALTLIVLIGSGFMMGLSSSSDVLRKSVDDYYDQTLMQDLQVYSSYGFCREDYDFISKIEGVKDVFASKTIDCNGSSEGGEDTVFRVSELIRKVNNYELLSGRMPVKNDECIILADNDFKYYEVGQKIKLDYGENDIHNYLKNDEFTIVGTFKSPEYMAKILGPSNFNNKDLQAVIFIPNANFIFDYYTTMYVTLEDAGKLVSYTDKYDRFIETQKASFENEIYPQQAYLRDRLVEEAKEELAEKEELFNKLKTDGQKELDDAKAMLDEAAMQIASYEAQISMLEMTARSLQAAVNQDKPILEEIYGNTAQAENDINQILESLGLPGDYHYATSIMSYTKQAYEQIISQLYSARYQLNAGKAQYEEGMKEYQEGLVTFNKQIADGELQLRLAKQRVEELPKAKWMVFDRSMQYSALMYKNTIDQMNAIGIYLPIMFFLVAALVCLTTMKRLIDEQRGQIGIFVALGYSNGRIIMKYVTYALIASIVGGILGILIGNPLFSGVIYSTWRMMYFLPEINLYFPPKNVTLSLGLFTVLMCLVTAYVARSILGDVPAQLMRPKAPKKAKEILLEKIGFIWNRMSFTSKITARNIFRYKSRFLMTILGIAGCTGLLVIGFGVKDSVSDVLDIQYGRIFNYDYQIFLESDEHVDENIDILNANQENDYVCSYMNYTTRFYLDGKEATASLIVMDPRDANMVHQLTETDCKTPIKLSNDGIVVSQRFAQNNKLKKGDIVTIESVDGIKADVKVANICEMYFQHFAFLSTSMYESLFEEKTVETMLAVKTSNKQALLQDCNRLKDFQSLYEFSKAIDQFNQMIQALNLIIGVVILVAGSLAFVVLFNLTQVNISERIREIATLKVLGFREHEINMYIFKEIFLLTLIGAALGMPLGTLEHHFIMRVMSMEMIMFGLNIKPISYVYSFLITLIFTFIVLLFMRKPLKKVDMIESLKSVE